MVSLPIDDTGPKFPLLSLGPALCNGLQFSFRPFSALLFQFFFPYRITCFFHLIFKHPGGCYEIIPQTAKFPIH